MAEIPKTLYEKQKDYLSEIIKSKIKDINERVSKPKQDDVDYAVEKGKVSPVWKDKLKKWIDNGYVDPNTNKVKE